MAARWLAAMAAALILAGCAPDYPLWTPDGTSGPSGQPLANPGDPPNRPTLDYGSRRWLGGEPDVYAPPPDSAATAGPGGSAVLAPRDPTDPYTASGGGYTRHGTTIIGPGGESHSIVGSTVFGPDGKPCSVVGSSLFCN
ncbi:MAG TPA: hypothetical protein VF274_12865 [Alphaproteobacteria bacterium]|jgi:hypothetical protein